jgi:hypothetical protein
MGYFLEPALGFTGLKHRLRAESNGVNESEFEKLRRRESDSVGRWSVERRFGRL